jgi:hypothetical protein
MAQKTAAKLKKSLGAKHCDDLMDLMDQQEDAKQDADDLSPGRGRSKGVPKEDLSDDEEDTKEEEGNEEEYERAVEAIMNANIEDGSAVEMLLVGHS